jgi:hypothetical protein
VRASLPSELPENMIQQWLQKQCSQGRLTREEPTVKYVWDELTERRCSSHNDPVPVSAQSL